MANITALWRVLEAREQDAGQQRPSYGTGIGGQDGLQRCGRHGKCAGVFPAKSYGTPVRWASAVHSRDAVHPRPIRIKLRMDGVVLVGGTERIVLHKTRMLQQGGHKGRPYYGREM